MTDIDSRKKAAETLFDQDQIKEYLDFLFEYVDWEPGQYVNVRGLGEKGTDKEGVFREQFFIEPARQDLKAEVIRHAQRWSEHGIGSFILPAVLDAASGEENHVILMPNIVCDLDSGDTATARAQLAKIIGMPSLTVFSGGETDTGAIKQHLYWRLTEPCDDPGTITNIQERIARHVGGDWQAFKRSTQIIRIPGSVHGKGGNPRRVIMSDGADTELEISDAVELVNASIPTIQNTLPSVSGAMNFQRGAHKRTVADTMAAEVTEGGDEHNNRWSAFSQVAGHYIHQVRLGFMSLEEAQNLTHGWMTANMAPAWPMQRFVQEFTGLLNKDTKSNGPLPPDPRDVAVQEAAKPWIHDLKDWAAHRWVPKEKPVRRFLVEGLIPAGVPMLFAAEGGAGKTFAMLDLALSMAAADGKKTMRWMGNMITEEATDKYVILITAEDGKDELAIRLHDLDTGYYRDEAGDKLIILPLSDMGGAFPLVERGRDGLTAASGRWTKLLDLMSKLDKPISAVIIDTLNSTLHGEEISALVIQEYFRELYPVCSKFGASVIITHHIRKQGKNKMVGIEDMREAVRGSTALGASVRAMLGMWHAHDYLRQMKAMKRQPQRGMLYRFGVLKANNPEMMQDVKMLMRQEGGMLKDVTDAVSLPKGYGMEHGAWLELAIKLAADAGFPFSKTGDNGLYAQRQMLPPALRNMGRDKLHDLCDILQEQSKVVTCRPAKGGTISKWLDIPNGRFAEGNGYVSVGAWEPPRWDDVYEYDPSCDLVVRI